VHPYWFVREKFESDYQYLYRQVSYDHEPIFAVGSMLSVGDCFAVLSIIDVAEKVGLDIMSAGVALAWPPKRRRRGLSRRKRHRKTHLRRQRSVQAGAAASGARCERFLPPARPGYAQGCGAVRRRDFACVLAGDGGICDGEVYFASQALGLRHSHLDSGGYSYDQKEKGKDR